MFESRHREMYEYHNRCDELAIETAVMLAVPVDKFLVEFEEWLGTTPLGRLNGLEACHERAAAGWPMFWQRDTI